MNESLIRPTTLRAPSVLAATGADQLPLVMLGFFLVFLGIFLYYRVRGRDLVHLLRHI
jgi:LPXTG-motif cell wall-anchored protein